MGGHLPPASYINQGERKPEGQLIAEAAYRESERAARKAHHPAPNADAGSSIRQRVDTPADGVPV